MQQTTLSAFDTCYNVFDEIKKGNIKQTELNAIFSRLSKLDYRNEHEIKIDFYIDAFLSGAQKKVSIDNKYRTARNSPTEKMISNLKYYCTEFLKEHFKKVRQEFWPKYKSAYDSSWESSKIRPQEILIKIKEIEDANKRRKAEIKAND